MGFNPVFGCQVVETRSNRRGEKEVRYWFWMKGKKGEPEIFEDWILPGLIPDRVFDLMECNQVPKLCGLCEKCPWHGAIVHVIESDTGRKFCPVLFYDVVKPKKWKVEDLDF
jgi:hypothetical protein